jgi:hypothetical protein
MAEADCEAGLPVRDSDRESSATSQESLIQSTLIHAGKRCMVCLTQKAITWTSSSRSRADEMCTEGKLTLYRRCTVRLYFGLFL